MIDTAYPAQFRKKLLSVKEKEGLTNKESVSRWKSNPNPVFKRNRPAQKIDMEALKKDVEEHPKADDVLREEFKIKIEKYKSERL